jgi:hypothetical protein
MEDVGVCGGHIAVLVGSWPACSTLHLDTRCRFFACDCIYGDEHGHDSDRISLRKGMVFVKRHLLDLMRATYFLCGSRSRRLDEDQWGKESGF